ncbi:MAG: isochorismate synthase [Candidatus Hydrogenedentes bacterium]|nr:isochorismate synthase [Candidatus Hydrogenedentota bacterium]
MSTGYIFQEEHVDSLAHAQLVERLEEALSAALTAAGEAPRVFRVEAPLPNISPLKWLRAQRPGPRVYWSDRDGIFESAGVGEACVVGGVDPVDYTALFARLCETLTPAYPNLSFYGGIQFDSASDLSPQWAPFGSYRFVAPKFELFRSAGATRFACTIVSAKERSVRDQIADTILQLRALSFGVNELPADCAPPLSRRDAPDYAGWADAIRQALAAAEQGAIEKVVLARESRFTFSEPLDPLALLVRLTDATPNSYHFCFQASDSTAFIGASPERLFRREGQRLESEALAGTRPRGADEISDQALGNALMQCDKDIREHRFVFEALRHAFAALCDYVTADPDVSLIKLQVCQHLWRRIEGALRPSVSDPDILRALHPTPAVGGYPTAAALALIPRLEPFHRGWYAGPVGRITHDTAEFAVAIRSGLVQDSFLAVYSGAGILPGSHPESEWAEIENKMGTFLSVLSANGG